MGCDLLYKGQWNLLFQQTNCKTVPSGSRAVAYMTVLVFLVPSDSALLTLGQPPKRHASNPLLLGLPATPFTSRLCHSPAQRSADLSSKYDLKTTHMQS